MQFLAPQRGRLAALAAVMAAGVALLFVLQPYPC